jgi:hypothetical protein
VGGGNDIVIDHRKSKRSPRIALRLQMTYYDGQKNSCRQQPSCHFSTLQSWQ